MSDFDTAAPAAPEATADTGGEELTEALEGAEGEAKPEEKKVETPSSKRKYSAKVNNRVREIELDTANDEEVQRYIQKALAADEKFEEAAAMRRAVGELINELKSNPRAVLAHESIGLNLREFAQQILEQELEEMEKSPEQKKMEEMEKRIRDFESEKERLMKEREQSERSRQNEEALAELDEQITSALNKSELPKSPYIVKRIADTMHTAVELGFYDVTVSQIMPFVEQQVASELSRMFEEAPEATADKVMERLVGKKSLDGYRSRKVAKMRKPSESSRVQDTGGSAKAKAPAQEEKPQRFSDVFGKF